LINVPCGGYGDVIKCIKIFTYFKKWYPGINVQILSSSKQKFRNLGIKAPIIDIKHKTAGDDPECNKFNWTIPSEIELKKGHIDCSDNKKAGIIREKYGDQYCVSDKKGSYTGKQVEYVCSKTGKKYCSDKLCFS